MPARARDERETCILLNDSGSVTVWSCSPHRIRQLSRRLGEPHESTGPTRFWHLDLEAIHLTLPRRRGAPRKPAGRPFPKRKTPSESPSTP